MERADAKPGVLSGVGGCLPRALGAIRGREGDGTRRRTRPPPPASQAGAGAQSLGQTRAPENASGGTHALNTFSLSFAWQQVDGPLRRMKAIPPAPVYGEPRFANASRILSLLPSPPSQIRTLRRKGKKNKNLIGLLLLPKYVSFQALQFFSKSPPYPSESTYFLQKIKIKKI